MTTSKYRPFKEARKFARSLGLQSRAEWTEYVKLGKLPLDIPKHPNEAYLNKGWTGWGDFLGTGNIATFNRKYRSFDEARKFARTLDLKNNIEWQSYCKSGNKPEDIPSSVYQVYANKGWKGMEDFLGVPSYRHTFRSYKEAQKHIKSLNLSGENAWRKYIKTNQLPKDIPTHPDRVYKAKGWTTWGDFFGTGIIATYKQEFFPFDEAREFARSLELKSKTEWSKYSSSGTRPVNIPSNPGGVYKGWKGWADWLGTDNVKHGSVDYRSFEEAREFVQSLGLKSGSEWEEYSKSENKPNDIPSSPNYKYKGKGWKGWGDFLGTGTIATQNREFRSFSDARKYARSLGLKFGNDWTKLSKSGKLPNDIPSNPWRTYSKLSRRRKK